MYFLFAKNLVFLAFWFSKYSLEFLTNMIEELLPKYYTIFQRPNLMDDSHSPHCGFDSNKFTVKLRSKNDLHEIVILLCSGRIFQFKKLREIKFPTKFTLIWQKKLKGEECAWFHGKICTYFRLCSYTHCGNYRNLLSPKKNFVKSTI